MFSKKYLIVMAAGHGSRMGADLPKQFLSLGGKAILHRTIEKFEAACPDIRVITVLPVEERYTECWKDYCLHSGFTMSQILVRGGITRFHSVRNALSHLPSGAIVAIHDGVRPLVSPELIRSMFERIEEDQTCEALIPVLPSVDTLRRLVKTNEDGHEVLSCPIDSAVDRNEIFAIQTPQIFRSGLIKYAYEKLPYSASFTDDASVAFEAGIRLSFCKGERLNFKITTKEDLSLAEMVIARKH